MPQTTTIRYLTKHMLSDIPKVRFQQLLGMRSSWELSEMIPFIDDLRNKSVKLESFVMKYARKKTVGRKIIITAK
jgi:sister chromatid cohesion protein DCC1